MPDPHGLYAQAPAHDRSARQRRTLRTTGLVVLAVAGVAVIFGIVHRNHQEAALTHETDAAAIPIVSLIDPKAGSGQQDLMLPGTVSAYFEAPIYARVNGYVRNWFYDIGARVKKGDILATIETPELDQQIEQARGEMTMAQANLALAQVTAKRWHALLGSNAVSEQSADEKASNAQAQQAVLDSQKAHLESLIALAGFKQLKAPFDGVVTARNLDIGSLINQGASNSPPLFKVADLHEMRVYVRVPQVYAGELHTGMKASLSEPQYRGISFPAQLATTSNAVNQDSRTVLVELLAPNPDGKLWPGTYAQMDFHLQGDPHVTRIPTSAIIFREHGAQIAVIGPGNKVVFKDVELGRNSGTEIEVLSGLAPGDRVVNSPPDTLQAGEQVQLATAAAP